MNDFTKEELENILNGNAELYPHTYLDLRNKIQSLIDNYCEPCDHIWLNMAYKYYQCDKCFVRKGMHE